MAGYDFMAGFSVKGCRDAARNFMTKGAECPGETMVKKTLAMILLAGAVTMALTPEDALANGMNRILKVNALGGSFDVAAGRDFTDLGLYASYRLGFSHIFSVFFSADGGYRFISKSVNARAGVQAMVFFVGLETGLISAYRTRRPKHPWYDRETIPGPWAPGAYLGLAGVIPSRSFALFLSAGGNFYFVNRDHEFYFMATGLVNFARN